ncbi:hypothetical protein AQ490_08205 [Wenjunlia vitaminophila]|uniref:Rv2525c-like glycoside hydrolase-like domain-containing protein n=1 Tax=Wenjunlia vitaminophila TaxID=76728 RepID=A0A0T6LNG0_WENVI|nr:DUF1906 domain-containing protein [Wenjunlia vitaminophila]KRV47426.1 hypothetical protein AQ490_08205 [Wenjunlia vitaminophila]
MRVLRRLTANLAVVLALTAGPLATAAPADTTGPSTAPAGPRVFRGWALDTCTAPALDTLAAWYDTTHYRALGIYVGGHARACAQPRLDRSWVAGADRAGWGLLPLYVGSQPPCVTADTKQEYLIDSEDPRAQARHEAADAVRKARALGIAQGSPLYLDMEHYDSTDSECVHTVLEFTRQWTRSVHAAGYLSGFYSSADSGIRSLAAARRQGQGDLPDVVWFARWNGERTLDEPLLRPDEWHPHRRIHQYAGDIRETHGGHTLLIDRNMVDAPVAVVGS